MRDFRSALRINNILASRPCRHDCLPLLAVGWLYQCSAPQTHHKREPNIDSELFQKLRQGQSLIVRSNNTSVCSVPCSAGTVYMRLKLGPSSDIHIWPLKAQSCCFISTLRSSRTCQNPRHGQQHPSDQRHCPCPTFRPWLKFTLVQPRYCGKGELRQASGMSRADILDLDGMSLSKPSLPDMDLHRRTSSELPDESTS